MIKPDNNEWVLKPNKDSDPKYRLVPFDIGTHLHATGSNDFPEFVKTQVEKLTDSDCTDITWELQTAEEYDYTYIEIVFQGKRRETVAEYEYRQYEAAKVKEEKKRAKKAKAEKEYADYLRLKEKYDK